MTKNKGGSNRRRRKNSKDIEEDSYEEEEDHDFANSATNNNLSFTERRELQRKTAADKRRQKMKCHLCGKTGHIRKECPGIEDDGRGESKYTKSHGDAGATILKNKGRSTNNKKKKKNQRGNKERSKSNYYTCSDNDDHLVLPPGFEKKTNATISSSSADDVQEQPFKYFDAGFEEGTQVLEYLRFGRSGGSAYAKKHSRKEAIEEYDTALKRVINTTNFGGCISRITLTKKDYNANENKQPLLVETRFPFCMQQLHHEGEEHDATTSNISSSSSNENQLLYFVVGLGSDFDGNDGGSDHDDDDTTAATLNDENMIKYLVSMIKEHNNDDESYNNNNQHSKFVGVFADLDYTTPTTKNRELQLRRLDCTIKAAIEIDCPIQIRISSLLSSSNGNEGSELNKNHDDEGNNDASNDNTNDTTCTDDPYLLAIRDLGKLLLDAGTTAAPFNDNNDNNNSSESESEPEFLSNKLKVHLSCWNGKSDHMMAFVKAFPYNLYVGFDATVTFSKAKHLHECAFDIPLSNILLETGQPSRIPSIVANKISSKDAFCHSGYIPYIADSIANYNSPTNNFIIPAEEDHDKNVSIAASELLPVTTTTTVTAEMVARAASTNTKSLYGISF